MSTFARPRSGELLEREHELERVADVLGAGARQEGGALVVEGAAGVGKSRLLDEVCDSASGLGLSVFRARATELEQGFPFGVVRQLFERPLLEAESAQRDRWLAGAAARAAEVLKPLAEASSRAPPVEPSDPDTAYAWQHGLYWLASNIAAETPLALVVDDLQWCDAPSAGALAFIARRLDEQALAMILATRPLDPAVMPEAATLVGDASAELLRPAPLTQAAVARLIADHFSAEPDDRFVRACLDVTGGNPFLLGELLTEAAASGLEPTATAAADVAAIVPRGVANTVLLRLARMAPEAATLARALSVLGDGTQISDAARLAGLAGTGLEEAMAALVSAGVVESGGTVQFVHPILRTAIYDDLSLAERERLHLSAAAVLRQRGAPVGQVAAQVMHTEPTGDAEAVELLRRAAHDGLALGDAAGAAALLGRALDEPPAPGLRHAVLFELGQARARAGAADAIAPLSEIVEESDDEAAIAAAAIELSDMLFYGGRAAEGAAILQRAQERLPAGSDAREKVQVALLGISYTSAAARGAADDLLAELRASEGSCSVLEATRLAALGMDELLFLGSASKAADLAAQALAAGLPVDPQCGLNWAILVLATLGCSDRLDDALRAADVILTDARGRGSALTVATTSALRANIQLRRGELVSAQADAQTALVLAPDLLGAQFVSVLAVTSSVLGGIEREESPQALRRLLDRAEIADDTDFTTSTRLRLASGVLRAAGGNHEGALVELLGCALLPAPFGGENPAILPWRSAAALSLADLGRREEARSLAADEVARAKSFGARPAMGIALRAQAIVGPAAERGDALSEALAVLAPSAARFEHARVLVDLGATMRASGQRRAAREHLLEGLELASRCGGLALERRARAELAAIGVRPRRTDRSGADSLTPSELRVVELAAGGGTNREIAQTLFVTEKTVETHLGHAFRKLDVSSRRQLPDVLASAR